jgi:rhomboid protease GluP
MAAPRRAEVKPPAVTPTVTYTLIGTCVIVYLLQVASQNFLGGDLPAALGVKANSLIVQGQIWRLFTPMFLHASIPHILFNMYALYSLGPGLERYYGHWRYLLLYILSGFAGNVASFMLSPNPSLGSSTAIFGLLGAEGIFLYQNRKLFGNMAQRALTQIVLIAVVNLIIGLSPGIDNWGHVGGLIAGTLFAWFAGPLLQIEGIYPTLGMVDQRETRDVLLAGLGVGVIFVALTTITILMRGG